MSGLSGFQPETLARFAQRVLIQGLSSLTWSLVYLRYLPQIDLVTAYFRLPEGHLIAFLGSLAVPRLLLRQPAR